MRTVVLSVSLILACHQIAATQVGDAASSGEVIDRIIAASNARDLDKLMSYVGDGVTVRGGLGPDAPILLSGKAKLREVMAAFWQKAPQFRVRSASRIEQQYFVIDQLTATGLPGREAEDGVIIYEISSGKVVRVWALPKIEVGVGVAVPRNK